MSTDQHGLAISGADAATIAEYDAYLDAFLGYGSDIRRIFEAADRAPDCAFVNAHAAILHMAFEGREGFAAAAPFLDRAVAAARFADARERAFIAVAQAWARKDFAACLAQLDDIARAWPEDLAAVKWAQYHAFNLGRSDLLLALGERAVAAHDGAPFVHGLYAFGLEQAHRLEEAEEQGRRAVEIRVDDAWAQHAVAHVMESQGRYEEGGEWLGRCSHTWRDKGVFIRDHNWWHAALFALHGGDAAKALHIYDAHLWGSWPEFPQEIIGAVSMLWRLEMAGAAVGGRWRPIVKQARRRAGEHILPFHDLHYAFALARAGTAEEADAFLKSMAASAEALPEISREIWREVALPAARGVVDFARGRMAQAAERLGAVAPHLQAIGGSHAQRAVFAETLAAARAEAGGAGSRALTA